MGNLKAGKGDDNGLFPHTFEVNGVRVMLTADVAALFDVETRQVTQNIKNNRDKLGESYAFQLDSEQVERLRSLGMISKPGRGGSRALPWVLTQKGALRLATIMNAPRALEATDIIIDVFAEVVSQLAEGKTRIEVSQPSRLSPDPEGQKEAQKLRRRISKAFEDLLDTVVDTKANTTVKDELEESARTAIKEVRAWLKSKQISNDKIEAETILILEQARDMFERRESELADAALDREAKALEIVRTKLDILEQLWGMYERLEPNAVISTISAFQTGPAISSLPPPEDE